MLTISKGGDSKAAFSYLNPAPFLHEIPYRTRVLETHTRKHGTGDQVQSQQAVRLSGFFPGRPIQARYSPRVSTSWCVFSELQPFLSFLPHASACHKQELILTNKATSLWHPSQFTERSEPLHLHRPWYMPWLLHFQVNLNCTLTCFFSKQELWGSYKHRPGIILGHLT